MSDRVGFIGLGIMGGRMAANLARAGVELTVQTRTREKAEAFAGGHPGVAVAGSPADVAKRSDVVITMVVDAGQVEELLLGPQGAARSDHGDLLCVDMSTIGAARARRIGAALASRGVGFVDAPVTGSAPRAQDGTLTIMAGGEERDVARVDPLLRHMGSLVVHAGPLGHGQLAKVLNNAVAAANAVTLAEALLVGDAAGLDLDALEQVMGAGSGASAMLALKAGAMREHDFAPLFKASHMLKDVILALEEAQAAGAPFEAAARAQAVLTATLARGHGEADFAALIEALEGPAGRALGGSGRE
ncbi:MAG: NAD(P)-dependent oxidoreductase [Actinomycetota bacterium]|jgi:3-hydroxyisobutyrate dehydrogenase-like beta-hydroxyacid dehydrogenase|nr:NAD(P)-dependent oxidoreductase [Solirubrobacterales bacterium]MBA3860734.1 NAD(P)-dependent oxidoreductase [Solirubrobacterales bacterium]MDQ3410326.1 NAD(P)-dependent oxidoreductase [Actinomycetota bacterium]